MSASISIVIPTTCESRREASLMRAIESLQQQDVANHEILIVVNGSRVDPALFARLESIENSRVFRLEEGSYPLALKYGRAQVATEYFCFLDDDDEYLPGALRIRREPMISESQIDFVATNGVRRVGKLDEPVLSDAIAINRDPLSCLLQKNWLASCGGMYRTATVTEDFFDASIRASEWTYLAFCLVRRLQMKFLDVPTFRIYDSAESLSKSVKWMTDEVATLERMIDLENEPERSRLLQQRRAAALHGLADLHRERGNYAMAWKFHVSSLKASGLKHLLFTRKLILPSSRPAKA